MKNKQQKQQKTFYYLIGEKFVGVIFRRLKVSSNRKKFVTFHRRKHLTNFEISNFSKNIISEKKYRYIFLFFYNNVHVNVNIYNSLLVVLKTVPLDSHYVRF